MTTTIPPATRRYLSDPCLDPLWAAVRRKLERQRLAIEGVVTVTLDDSGAAHLSGLLSRRITPGRVRVALDVLDEALRRSAAAHGLLTVVAEITGRALVDRTAVRERARESWSEVFSLIDERVARPPWGAAYVAGLRRSGLLTRVGVAASLHAIGQAAPILDDLFADGAGDRQWERAELAARHLGDAHGLDDGRLVASLVLRALAAAQGSPPPETAADRRDLWHGAGVIADQLSGTVLVWGLRPPGLDRWSAMMRERADLGLATHLTVHELLRADVRYHPAGGPVFACENPQVLQAAIRTPAEHPLMCLYGNPAAAGLLLLRRLAGQRVNVRYHGDFDWPGLAIARRIIGLGAEPWRMSADDYESAVPADDRATTLHGRPVATPWDPRLETVMRDRGVAVHEEAVLESLLPDLL
ncbi:TIGR02679 family protein [Herbidospora sp. NBRC 101105]|uniref:TIGR02679 family protein n=1 Tax=Herbidospora sp. NBRC 101105 TaxID=3032195 RepID=UPI0024A4D2A2|nr:TIGR02679 family protein [Herbidospora sp. NBRC 101105]GLX97652.1 hypothetical protein Hesp01_56020 [Herbidospora sp. NBRC 101105]